MANLYDPSLISGTHLMEGEATPASPLTFNPEHLFVCKCPPGRDSCEPETLKVWGGNSAELTYDISLVESLEGGFVTGQTSNLDELGLFKQMSRLAH